MKTPSFGSEPASPKPTLPRPPAGTGMNLHDWATLASAFLLILVIVLGLLLWVIIDAKLSKLDEQQTLMEAQVKELKGLSSQAQLDAAKGLKQQVTDFANASEFLKDNNDALATNIGVLKQEVSTMEQKLNSLLKDFDARLKEQQKPQPAASQSVPDPATGDAESASGTAVPPSDRPSEKPELENPPASGGLPL